MLLGSTCASEHIVNPHRQKLSRKRETWHHKQMIYGSTTSYQIRTFNSPPCVRIAELHRQNS